MRSPLDRIRGKLRRADEHYQAWDAALESWLDRHPYSIDARSNEATGWVEIRLVEREPPPLDLALVFADFLTNLRTALDHLVWHLVTREGRNADEREIAFPVVAEASSWEGARGRRLECFPSDWMHVVHAAQPFHYGAAYKQHPLYVLHRLDIENKHRLLLPLSLVYLAMDPEFELSRSPRDGEKVIEQRMHIGPGQLTNGVLLTRFRCVSEENDLRISQLMNIRNVEIAVGPVSSLTAFAGKLPNMLVFVGSVIEDLSPAF